MSALFRVARPVDFDRLYRRHASSVYRYTYAVLGNHADAEDVTQQTFLRAYRSIARGTKPRKAENWLVKIAHNEVRRHFQSAQAKPVEVELDERLAHSEPEPSDPSLADVLRALQRLSPMQRSALVMREFEGRSYAEIAELLDMTQSALEAHLFRARRALAEQLEEAFTCHEAEEAVLRRLDGRLPRRIGRRLRTHLHDCTACVRFADVQQRQRAVLKGLSLMPIPASLFLFRAEHAAAGGLGATAAASGGSAAVGGGATAGAGAAGIGAGLAAKAAAVGAAAAVAGGVGFGVTQKPERATGTDRAIARSVAVSDAPHAEQTAAVAARLPRVDQRASDLPRAVRSTRKLEKAKHPQTAPAARPAHVARAVAKPLRKWKEPRTDRLITGKESSKAERAERAAPTRRGTRAKAVKRTPEAPSMKAARTGVQGGKKPARTDPSAGNRPARRIAGESDPRQPEPPPTPGGGPKDAVGHKE